MPLKNALERNPITLDTIVHEFPYYQDIPKYSVFIMNIPDYYPYRYVLGFKVELRPDAGKDLINAIILSEGKFSLIDIPGTYMGYLLYKRDKYGA